MATNYVIGENKSLREFKTINEVTATTEVKDKTKIYSVENDLYYLKNGEPSKIGSGGAGGGLVKTTYAELKTLITNNELAEGSWYRITDYTCKVDSAQKWVKSAEHQFDIIVLATSTNTIDENAFAIQHEGDTYFQYANLGGWKLKYSLDNSKCNYIDTTDGKGCIYYMEDEFGNECDYDFKNILMLRYEVTASTKSEFSFSVSRIFTDQTNRNNWTINTSTKNYFYTFSFCANSDLSNLQDLSVMDGIKDKAFYGNEFYSIDKRETNFQPSCMIICPSGSNTITLSRLTTCYLYYNKSLSRFKNNTFNCLISTSSAANHSNSFGNDNYSNSFGNYNASNSFGNDNYSNSFGNDNYSNLFGNNNVSNSFGNDNYSNSFGNYNYSNSFGNNNVSNSFGNYNAYWKVGSSSGCNGCFIGNYIQGTDSSYWTINGRTRVQYWG